MSRLFPERKCEVGAAFWPAILTFFLLSGLVMVIVASAGGDFLALARLGSYYSQGDPEGSQGYDGQFVYYIAREPHPELVRPFLDVPAYRYQRILLPILAHWIALGEATRLPWVIPLIGLISHAFGTWTVSVLMLKWGVNPWYGLVYGLWVGFALAVRLDLPETLAYAFVVGAYLAWSHQRIWVMSVLMALGAFSKEITLLFVGAALVSFLLQKEWKHAVRLSLIVLLPYGIFQLWLWRVFGQPGIGSGGAMATPFEWIPYMGLMRIWFYSHIYALAMLVVFGPVLVFPSLWGIWVSLRKWVSRESNVVVLGLLFNALSIAFMPFSTFRETGGALRYACGLVLAVLLFAGYYRLRRVLNYSILWIVLNVFLLKS